MEEERNRDGYRSAKTGPVRGRGSNRGHGRRGRGENGGELQTDVCPQHLRFIQYSISNKFQPPFEHLHIDVRVRLRNIPYPDDCNNVTITDAEASLPSLPTGLPQQKVVRKYTASELLDIRNDVVKQDGSYLPLPGFDKEGEWSIFRYMSCPEITGAVDVSSCPELSPEPKVLPGMSVVHGNISSPDHSNDLKITDAEASLPSLQTGISQLKVVRKYTASELISIRNGVVKQDNSYLPLPGFDKEGELSKFRNMYCPDPVNCSEITAEVDVCSFPEPEAVPSSSMSVVPNPTIHHHVIDIRSPDGFVRLPSSEKEGVSENMVIGFMKKLVQGLSFGAIKVFRFWYEKGLPLPYNSLHGIFKRR